MEIITMESTAYKELVEKIDRIAGYVQHSKREKKKDTPDIWLNKEQGHSRRSNKPPPTKRRSRKNKRRKPNK